MIRPLVLELGTAEVLGELEAQNGGLVADACKKTVKTLVRNAAENVENQILQVSFFVLPHLRGPTAVVQEESCFP